MWKQYPLMRRCMDVNIVKKIAEYIKIDLSGNFEIVRNGSKGYIWFRYSLFENSHNNNYGWYFETDEMKSNTEACSKCLKPTNCYCNHIIYITKNVSVTNWIKNISGYMYKFRFDNPVKSIYISPIIDDFILG
jgi:hypothetical protein